MRRQESQLGLLSFEGNPFCLLERQFAEISLNCNCNNYTLNVLLARAAPAHVDLRGNRPHFRAPGGQPPSLMQRAYRIS